jgi:hypothetical protein
MKSLILISFLFYSGAFVSAADVKPTQDVVKSAVVEPGGKDSMGGYKIEDFGSFAETWKMITVRYREDSEEMRVVYANPLAAKTLGSATKGGKINYPDGSVFAKIGVKTDRDPLFASSIVPSGARRFQFMIRDKKKYAETDGWGYVLFDSEGLTFPGDEKANVTACHACHRVAAGRDFVFSELAPFNSKKGIFNHTSFLDDQLIEKSFQTKKKSDVTKLISKYLDSAVHEVRVYDGPMRAAAFQGTLDEIIPLLIRESVTNSSPALFLAGNDQEFTLVQVTKSVEKCVDKMKPYYTEVRQTMAVPKKKRSGEVTYQVIQKTFCHSGR